MVWEDIKNMKPKRNNPMPENLETNVITNDIKNVSMLNPCKDIGKGKRWIRNCPICNRPIQYTRQDNMLTATRKNLPCRGCGQKLKPYEYLFNSLVYKCKIRKIKCFLTYDDFLEFTKIINCHYCGATIQWISHNFNGSKRGYKYNLDRIDNNLGYTKSNCCVCCSVCNGVKSDVFSYPEMIEIGKTINQLRNR